MTHSVLCNWLLSSLTLSVKLLLLVIDHSFSALYWILLCAYKQKNHVTVSWHMGVFHWGPLEIMPVCKFRTCFDDTHTNFCGLHMYSGIAGWQVLEMVPEGFRKCLYKFQHPPAVWEILGLSTSWSALSIFMVFSLEFWLLCDGTKERLNLHFLDYYGSSAYFCIFIRN